MDAADYIAVKRQLGTSVSAAGSGADFNGDGRVDRSDLALVMPASAVGLLDGATASGTGSDSASVSPAPAILDGPLVGPLRLTVLDALTRP